MATKKKSIADEMGMLLQAKLRQASASPSSWEPIARHVPHFVGWLPGGRFAVLRTHRTRFSYFGCVCEVLWDGLPDQTLLPYSIQWFWKSVVSNMQLSCTTCTLWLCMMPLMYEHQSWVCCIFTSEWLVLFAHLVLFLVLPGVVIWSLYN
jgi:hypothetical protein